jgi:SAM-dependent methyltransferase
MVASDKIERGPQVGTPWRQANWRFVQEEVAKLPADGLILDAGAGRGDFAAAFAGRRVLALDVYPYPEIDLVADLTVSVPLRPASFDAIALLNVLEHIYPTHAMLTTLAGLLKPGGRLIVAIPFMVKIHQAPVDFARFTHFALRRFGEEHGLEVERLEGYYDPLFFLGEGLGNLKNAVLPGLPAGQRRLARLQIRLIETLASGLGRMIGPGKSAAPETMRSLAPTGYQIVYCKK